MAKYDLTQAERSVVDADEMAQEISHLGRLVPAFRHPPSDAESRDTFDAARQALFRALQETVKYMVEIESGRTEYGHLEKFPCLASIR